MKTLCPQCSALIDSDGQTLETTCEIRQLACPTCGCLFQSPPAEPPPSASAVTGRWRQLRILNRNVLILGGAALLTLGTLAFFLAKNRGGDTHLTESKTTRKILQNEFFRRLVAAGRATEQDLSRITEPSAIDQGFVAVTTEKVSWKMAGELARRLDASILSIDALPGRDTKTAAAFLAQSLPELQGSTLWITNNQAPAIIDPPDYAPASDLDCPRPVLLMWAASAGPQAAVPKLATAGPRPPAPKLVPTGFVLIPAGEFQMGDQSSPLVGQTAELPVHAVHVSEFFMGKYEATKELWDSVRVWGLSNGYTDLAAGNGTYASKGASHPVHSISWYDVVKWCNARSQKERLKPCYTVSGAIFKTGSSDAVVCDWDANGYRLPTEAEWEKAARGGAVGKNFPWGTDTITHSQANYSSTALESYDASPTRGMHPTYRSGDPPWTSPVGSFAPNAYGLHDMTGNLWEWCWDWSGSYTAGAQTDPRGPSSGTIRMYRGGAWSYAAHNCRAASRAGRSPASSDYRYGFRFVRSSVP